MKKELFQSINMGTCLRHAETILLMSIHSVTKNKVLIQILHPIYEVIGFKTTLDCFYR